MAAGCSVSFVMGATGSGPVDWTRCCMQRFVLEINRLAILFLDLFLLFGPQAFVNLYIKRGGQILLPFG
jgi:hypothetical protein